MGSSLQDRAEALDRARLRPVTPSSAAVLLRQEVAQRKVEQDAFHIMAHPVTQYAYWHYTQATGAPEPWLDEVAWDTQHTGYTYSVVKRFGWQGGKPLRDRLDHPIVLVDQRDADAYCRWWGESHGAIGELPSELQWEKAARGEDGRRYPWGNHFGLDGGGRANTLESGRQDTIPVASIPETVSPYGVHDMAGNVYEWTRTPAGSTTFVVKGGAWNSDALSARAAARHARPASTRHVAIGFRCVLREESPPASPSRGRP